MKYFFVFKFLSSNIGGILAGIVIILFISLPTLLLIGILYFGDRERSWRKPAPGPMSLKEKMVLVMLSPLVPPFSLFTVTICVTRFAGDFAPDALLIWCAANLPGIIYLLVCALSSRRLLAMPVYATKPTLSISLRDAVPILPAILLLPPFNFLYLKHIIAVMISFGL